MRAFLAQTRMELLMSLRQSESLLVTMIIPVGLLIFLTRVEIFPLGGNRVGFLLPGSIAIATMAVAMVSLGIATGFERRHGVLKRLAITPLGRTGLIAAKTTATLGLVALQAILLTVTGAALGWRPGSNPGLTSAGLGLLLGTSAFAGIGLSLAGRLKAELNLAASNALFVFLLMAGGAIFPLDRLPATLEGLARILPLHPLSEILRAGATGAEVPQSLFVVLAAWAVGSPLVAAATFSWD